MVEWIIKEKDIVIDERPILAERIIRCRDCKYFHHSGECILFKPRLTIDEKYGEGFCAWAEEKCV